MSKEKIVISYHAGLGDIILVTALARDLELSYPGRFEISADTSFPSLWQHNPYCHATKETGKTARFVKLDLIQSIREARQRPMHALAGMRAAFERSSGIEVKPTKPGGCVFLTEAEKAPMVTGRYWVLIAGGKLDMTVKHWELARWQAVVNNLREQGIAVVQAGANCRNHVHPPLQNVVSTVGHTESVRDFVALIANAEGVMCGITGAMHIAACFDKPCVVVAGGIEEPHWEHYTDDYQGFGEGARPVAVPHRYFHTIGKLHCCQSKGCWKKRVAPLSQQDNGDRVDKLCLEPVRQPAQIVPACMVKISAEQVTEAVLSYYRDGTLAPYTSGPVERVRSGAAEFKEPSPKNTQLPIAVAPVPRTTDKATPLDHPFIGGRMTVCVLCYGDHAELARRSIGSLLTSRYHDRLDIRVLANGCGEATLAYLRALPLQKLIVWPENRFKGPAVRALWQDKEMPIITPYTLWFDDDSFVVREDWLDSLALCIAENHAQGARLYGIRFIHDLQSYQRDGHHPNDWFQQAKWWRNRNWETRHRSSPTANGSVIPFVSGGFLAIATDVVQEMDILDERLTHNGIDVCIGAMVYQAGYKVKDFNRNKVYIHSSGFKRRGWTSPFPWMDPRTQEKFYRDNEEKFKQAHGRLPQRIGPVAEAP